MANPPFCYRGYLSLPIAFLKRSDRGQTFFVVPDLIRDPFAGRFLLEMDSGSRYACPE